MLRSVWTGLFVTRSCSKWSNGIARVKRGMLNLSVIVMWVALALFVASEMVLAAPYFHNVNHQILLHSFLYGLMTSLVVLILSAAISKTSNAVFKFAGLSAIVSASSAVLFLVAPYTPCIATFGGPECFYLVKLAVVIASVSLSAVLGILNACKVRRIVMASWHRASTLADLGKLKTFIRYLRRAGTN